MSPSAISSPPASLRAVARLQELRVKAAGRAGGSSGDLQEIREDGLATFEALSDVRDRANSTIDDSE
ncbi:MAG: hypothetical protein WBM04_02465 [Candidatus Korobacteraceae bacterium]